MAQRPPLPRQLVLSAAVHARQSELHRALGELVVRPMDTEVLERFAAAQGAALAARSQLCVELDLEQLFAEAGLGEGCGAEDRVVITPDVERPGPDVEGGAG